MAEQPNFKTKGASMKAGKRLLAVLLIICMAMGVTERIMPAQEVFAAEEKETKDKYPYKICINKQMNCITIYAKDEKGKYTVPYKAFICSTGYATPLGNFEIEIQYRWKELINKAWGQYSSRVTWDGILIHSVWYHGCNEAAQNGSKFNALGTTCSSGCINLTVADCKWIYDNCPVGTPIYIYNSDNPGPLGKPEMLKVPHSIGYDPTDKWSKNNPYNDKKPELKGVKNRKVQYGAKYSVMDGVTAKNTTGYDATHLVKTVIRQNGKKIKKLSTKKPGVYEVTYKITDQIGRKDKKSAVITVVDNVKPVIKGAKDTYLPYGTVVTKEEVLKHVRAKWHKENLTDEMEITITETAEDTYEVKCSVTAPNGKKATAVCYFYIDPNSDLRFEGVSDHVFEASYLMTKELALEGVKAYIGEQDVTESIVLAIVYAGEDETYKNYDVIYTIGNEKYELSQTVRYQIAKEQKEEIQEENTTDTI